MSNFYKFTRIRSNFISTIGSNLISVQHTIFTVCVGGGACQLTECVVSQITTHPWLQQLEVRTLWEQGQFMDACAATNTRTSLIVCI